MRALHLEPDRYDDESRARLESVAEVDYAACHHQRELVERIASRPYEILVVKIGLEVDAEVLEAAPDLRYVLTPTTGLDHIDEAAAAARGVKVISLRGEREFLATVTSTAEHTWALLLALLRNLPAACTATGSGGWDREPFLAAELSGKTLGIVGYGRLGKIVARYAKAFGMEVLAHDTDSAAFDETVPSDTPLEDLLGRADVVSLHLPSNPSTRGFLDRAKFQGMKPGAWLVNTARGEVVDETALLEALQSGSLAGAALDVLDGDSVWEQDSPENHPLVAHARENRNLLLTPHMGGYGLDSIRMTRRFLLEKFLQEL